MTGIDGTPKKVLMTADTVGGVWTYCMELCRTLSQAQFHLVTAGAKMNEGQKREVKKLPNVVVYETEYKLEWMDHPWNDIDRSGAWLLELEEEIQPDLIHLNTYAYGVFPFKAPKIVVAHSDVFSWWLAVKGELPASEWSEYYQRVKAGLENAALVIAPSKSKLKSIHEIYGITTQHKVIYNGRSKERFYPGIKKPLIFSMGRVWDEAKNIRLLISAASKINYEIKIAGEQQFHKNELNLSAKHIQYLGKLNTKEIAAALSETSIYVLPAKYEPFGLSVLEAAYAGCALVLGDIPSLREIWQDAAIYVDTNNEESLAITINELMRDKKRLHRYQSKAAERANYFTATDMAGEYLHVYKQLIKSKEAYVKQATE